VTKTQSAGPISCLEHRATRVLHCTIVTRAAVLIFPLLLREENLDNGLQDQLAEDGDDSTEQSWVEASGLWPTVTTYK